MSGQNAGSELGVDKWLTAAPDLNGKFIVIDFWRTWCLPCIGNIKKLNAIQARFADKVVVVGITNETEDKVAPILRSFPTNYAVGIDPSDRLKKRFEVTAFPNVFIADPKGVIRWQGVPMEHWHNLTEEKIERLIRDFAG